MDRGPRQSATPCVTNASATDVVTLVKNTSPSVHEARAGARACDVYRCCVGSARLTYHEQLHRRLCGAPLKAVSITPTPSALAVQPLRSTHTSGARASSISADHLEADGNHLPARIDASSSSRPLPPGPSLPVRQPPPDQGARQAAADHQHLRRRSRAPRSPRSQSAPQHPVHIHERAEVSTRTFLWPKAAGAARNSHAADAWGLRPTPPRRRFEQQAPRLPLQHRAASPPPRSAPPPPSASAEGPVPRAPPPSRRPLRRSRCRLPEPDLAPTPLSRPRRRFTSSITATASTASSS